MRGRSGTGVCHERGRAVNTLNSLQQATLEEAGVNLSTVKFVEVGRRDMPLALKAEWTPLTPASPS